MRAYQIGDGVIFEGIQRWHRAVGAVVVFSGTDEPLLTGVIMPIQRRRGLGVIQVAGELAGGIS